MLEKSSKMYIGTILTKKMLDCCMSGQFFSILTKKMLKNAFRQVLYTNMCAEAAEKLRRAAFVLLKAHICIQYLPECIFLTFFRQNREKTVLTHTTVMKCELFWIIHQGFKRDHLSRGVH